MRKLIYVGLERYQARYTWQLEDWNTAVFDRRGIDYEIVRGQNLSSTGKIVTGSVLDAHGRSYYSLTQMAELVRMMQQGEITNEDVIFFEDMFTPGFESLPYIMDQCPTEFRPKIYVRCLAQTVDPDDFVNRENMFSWMRRYEQICDEVVDGIIVASEELVANLRIAGFKANIFVSGLPFGKEEVRSRLPKNLKQLCSRKRNVTFAARWDDEKLPHFYMDLAEAYHKIDPSIEFSICCGHPELKSNNQEYVDRALALQSGDTANFKIHTNLTKEQYYNTLAESRVMFNCALQDWVSNTVSEADTAETLTLYPAYRSFPEVFANNHNNMYIPWSVESATDKLLTMMNDIDAYNFTKYNIGAASDWQDGTIDRTLDIMLGDGDQWHRNGLDYRKHVSKPKY